MGVVVRLLFGEHLFWILIHVALTFERIVGSMLQRVTSYIGHLAKATDRHGVHSPFVYELIAKVLRNDGPLPEFAVIEALRRELLKNNTTIEVIDLGAGSSKLKEPQRNISSIARTALKSPKEARMFYRLAHFCSAGTMLELGTSFGISSLYLAQAAPLGKVFTIEGCPATARIAQANFHRLSATNITSRVGDFSSELPKILGRIDRLDLVFIDGHHAEEPTLHYFEQCLTKAHNDTVFVFDDIHWSHGMESAWERIKAHQRVTVTIDLFELGLVFLRAEQAQEHFKLRY